MKLLGFSSGVSCCMSLGFEFNMFPSGGFDSGTFNKLYWVDHLGHRSLGRLVGFQIILDGMLVYVITRGYIKKFHNLYVGNNNGNMLTGEVGILEGIL